jgi:hypothetical protein
MENTALLENFSRLYYCLRHSERQPGSLWWLVRALDLRDLLSDEEFDEAVSKIEIEDPWTEFYEAEDDSEFEEDSESEGNSGHGREFEPGAKCPSQGKTCSNSF